MPGLSRRATTIGSVLGLTALSCGGALPGGPTPTPALSIPASPTPAPEPVAIPAGTEIALVAADTGAAVSGARATLGGAALSVGGGGIVTLSQATAAGAALDVLAPGFLPRSAFLRPEPRVSLWPEGSASGLSAAFTREAVYSNGQAPLYRILAPRLAVVPDEAIRADPAALSAAAHACQLVTAAMKGGLLCEVAAQAGADAVPVRVVIDAQDPQAATGAGAHVTRSRAYANQGGSVVFQQLSNARSLGVVLHELGHHLGLFHTTGPDDIMAPGPSFRRDFSPREKLALVLMWQRRPGNVYPDDERQLGALRAERAAAFSCEVE